jgi:hypothetical protein
MNFKTASLLILAASLIACQGALKPVPTAETGGPDFGKDIAVVVDNHDPTFELNGNWSIVQRSSAHDGDCAWAEFWKNPPDGSIDPAHFASATARPKLAQPGLYEVFAWWCDAGVPGLATKQLVWLCASRGYSCVPIYLNPRENAGRWNSLGTYYLEPDCDVTIRNGETMLGAPPGFETIADGAVVVDAFQFAYRGPRPSTLTPMPDLPRPSPTQAPSGSVTY